MATSPFQPEGFVNLLEQFVHKRRSTDDLQEHPDFQSMLREICFKRFSFRSFNGVYGPEDLYQDSFIKVMKSAYALQAPDNVLDEEGFKKWLFVVVYTTFCSKYRQLVRAPETDLVPCEDSEAEMAVEASYGDLDGKYYLGLFLDFIKPYPEEHQRAVKLSLMGFSLRQIAEKFSAEGGTAVCHGTINNWVEAIYADFRENLGVNSPERLKRRSRGASRT
jgi:DNA-directed RNA polymerase specialized sigma24 family protein